MRNLKTRIAKRYQMTRQNWKSDCEFSKTLACLRVTEDLGGRAGLRRVSRWAHDRKQDWILDYLRNTMQPVIQSYRDTEEPGKPQDNAPIWVCWWSGEETAPRLVQQCIKSIQKHAGNHPVHIISEKNYLQYLEIPAYLLEKVHQNKIGLANFSDYLRVSLLAKYGGLWLDATIFCTGTIPEELFSKCFFTCKSQKTECGYLSQLQWTSFCLGGWRQQTLFEFMKDAFEQYWQTEDAAIDYLLVDYLIYLAREEVPYIRGVMDAVPINNVHRDDLQRAMNENLLAEEFWKVIREDTIFYKLSWRESYSEKRKDGKDSVYGYFLKLPIEVEGGKPTVK